MKETDLIRAVETIGQMRREGMPVRFGNCIPQCFTESSSTGCSSGDTFFTVDPWGDVRPCNHAPLIVGSLLNQTLEQVWHAPKMEEWRAMRPAQCKECAAFEMCRGGCRAQAMLLDQATDPLMSTPLTAYQPKEVFACLPHDALLVGCFTTRQDPRGYLLMRGSQTFLLPWEHRDLMKYLDGNFSVQQVASTCGSQVLPLLESLYQNGFISVRC